MKDVNSQVVERLESAILLTDESGAVLFASDRATALFGRNLTGARLDGGGFEDDLPLVGHVACVFRNAGAAAGHELIAAGGDQETRFYWVSVSAPGDATAPAGRLVTVLDVSAPLLESPAIRRVFSQVSHDLRSPLTSISGAAELLLSGRVGDLEPVQRRLLGIVEEGTRRMTEILARTRSQLAEAGATGGGGNE